MLALSPCHLTFGLPSEDQNWALSSDPFLYFNHEEWNSLDSFGGSPIENDQLRNLRHSGATSIDSSSKKQNHNASERERRQTLNGLYSILRSIVPNTDQKKKLSIPTTISQAVKYIPQLQNQVERLIQRKEEILSSISKQSDDLACYTRQNKETERLLLPTVSTSKITGREVVMQVCVSKVNNRSPFSAVLQNLEGEQLQILNASTFASCENKVLYTLHVQAKGTQRVQCEIFRAKINLLC